MTVSSQKKWLLFTTATFFVRKKFLRPIRVNPVRSAAQGIARLIASFVYHLIAAVLHFTAASADLVDSRLEFAAAFIDNPASAVYRIFYGINGLFAQLFAAFFEHVASFLTSSGSRENRYRVSNCPTDQKTGQKITKT
jgi:hypothetical protein